MCEAQEQLEQVIARMQAIQTAIKASGQPASMFERGELKELDRVYARLVDDQTNTSAGPSRA